MNKLSLILFLGLLLRSVALNAAPQDGPVSCQHWFSLFKPICQRFYQIATEGNPDLYLSGYAWHNRAIYSREKIQTFNEQAWGSGFGKSIFDEKGNWQGLYAIAFLDSHSDLQPVIGYYYFKMWHINQDLKAGLGFSALVTSRADMNQRLPIAGVVPACSVFLGKVSISASYVPGNSHNGNVLYLIGRYTFQNT